MTMNIDRLTRIILFIAVGTFFSLAIFFAVRDNLRSSIVFLTVGFLCLIFIFLSRFKRFKGFGFEAELWESKQEEAAELIATLRSLVSIVSQQLLSLSSRAGRWDSATPRKELFELHRRLNDLLMSINISERDREEISADYFYYIAVDMLSPIVNKINQRVTAASKEKNEQLAKLRQSTSNQDEYNKLISEHRWINNFRIDWKEIHKNALQSKVADYLIEQIYKLDFLSVHEKKELFDELKEEIADLREWIKHKNLRRPEKWLLDDPMKRP